MNFQCHSGLQVISADKKWLLTLLGILTCAIILNPFFEVKLLLIAGVIVLCYNLLPSSFNVSRELQLILITFAYGLSFLVMPYWSIKIMGFHPILVVSLLGGICLMLIVCYRENANEIIITKIKYFHYVFIVSFFVNISLLYSALTASVAYKGDSGYFIGNSLIFLRHFFVFEAWPLLILVVVSAILYLCTRRIVYLLLTVGCMLGYGVIAYLIQPDPRLLSTIARFPSLFYYFLTFFSYSFVEFYRNYLFSISAFNTLTITGTTLFAVIYACKLNADNALTKICLALCIITIPTLSYYATLPYIEIVILVFVSLSLLNYPEEVAGFAKNNTVGLGIMFLFVTLCFKETTIVYAVSFTIFTSYYVFFCCNKLRFAEKIFKVILFNLLTVIPLVVYLFFRLAVRFRPYHFNLDNFFILANYQVIVLSFWEQFGLFFPLSLISLIILIIRKKYNIILLNIVTILGYLAFFMGDGSVVMEGNQVLGTGYMGYSRFNLYVLPSVLCLVVAACNELHVLQKRVVVLIFTFVLICFNLYMSPYSYNGKRIPGWGDHTIKTSEQTYPYKSFYQWYSRNRDKKVVVLGRTFPYSDELYLYRYNIPYGNFIYIPVKQFANTKINKLKQYDYILYHVEKFSGGKDKQINVIDNFLADNYREKQAFSNQELQLKLFVPK